MKHGPSISLRLTFWFSTIFLCGFAAFAAFLWFDLNKSLLQGRERTLGRRATRILELLNLPENDTPERRAARYRDFTDATPEGKLIQVFSRDGTCLYPTVADPAVSFPWPPVSDSNAELRTEVNWEGRTYRVFVRSAEIAGKPVRIFVAGQLEDNRAQVQRFTETLVRGAPLMLLAAAMAGYFASRRALKPVARLIDSARSITIGNLSRRLPMSGNGDELDRLAETWNGMLARLEAAVGRITRFTGDASHELRSPLSLIRIASESALREPGLSPDAAETFSEILAEAESASRLLDDMLMLARSDAGHVEVEFAPVYLGDVVAEVTGKLRRNAEDKRQALEMRDCTGGQPVSGDASLLRRLAWILIDNGIKYTPSGGRIHAAVTSLNGNLVLSVTDSGRGISSAHLPHIFERFYRADPARSGEDGTGLGLAIAKWIADAHCAEIRVSSTENSGSTFEVAFPALSRS